MSLVPASSGGALVAADAPSAKRQRTRPAVVLDEDTFVSSVDAIVERDFYPDLPKLRAQQEYLDALQRNDIDKIRELQQRSVARLRQGATPTPQGAACATPARAGAASAGAEGLAGGVAAVGEAGTAAAAPGMTLNAFLERHTGEDNAAFERLREKEERKSAARRPWLTGTAAENEERRRRALEGGAEANRLLTWKYEPRNTLFYSPDGAEPTAQEQLEAARGSAPAVDYSGTRLGALPLSQQQEARRRAAEGSASASASSSSYTVLAMGDQEFFERRRLEREGGAGPVDLDDLVAAAPGSTPRAPASEHRPLLATPSPGPGPGESPFTTWGRVMGTPLLLDAPETPIDTTPGPQFRVPEAPRREQLGMQLADRAARSKRARTPARTPQPPGSSSSSSSSTGSSLRAALSPALAASPMVRRMLSPAGKAGSVLTRADPQLRASYSHSPAIKKEPLTPKIATPRSAVSTPKAAPSPAHAAAAASAPSVAAAADKSATSSVTDGLLKL
eukprot:m51a1_g10644 hypothetical protein (506) ;mRNA; r:24454-26297